MEGLGRFVPTLLVLVIVYAVLNFTKALGDNKIIEALVAVFIAALFLVSDTASNVIAFMAPWFVILFIFLIFTIIAFKAMGVTDAQIFGAMKSYRSISIWVISLSIIIGLLGIANTYGQGLLSRQPGYEQYTANPDGTFTSPEGDIVSSIPPGSATGSFRTNLTRTLFHPEILGFALIGLIASFSIYFMTRIPA